MPGPSASTIAELEATNAELRTLLREGLDDYAQHDSWRCGYPPHYYLADNGAENLKGDCPCGLLSYTERVNAMLVGEDRLDET
jgi:hypothetical protein